MATLTFKVLWASLCAAQLGYVLVIVLQQETSQPSSPPEALFLALLVIAIGTGLGTVIYRRRALVDPIRSGELDLNTPAGAGRAFTPYILNLVLTESVGIYGLVLSSLSHDPKYVIGFATGSLILMYVHRPTAPELQPPLSTSAGSMPPPI